MQQALDRAFRGDGRVPAHGVLVLVEDAGGHLLPPDEGLHRAGREPRLQPGGRLEDLPVGDVLPHVRQRGPLFQRENVFLAQHLGHPAAGGDERLVHLNQEGRRAVAGQAVEAVAEHVVGGGGLERADRGRREEHAGDAGPLADLVHDVRQPALLVGGLVLPDRVAGPLERPVRVQLAEDVVLVTAAQCRGPAGDRHRLAPGVSRG